MGEEDDVGRRLEAEVPERLQQHREQVHQVEEAERRQQLVEEAVQLLPGQQEDGGRVAWGIFIFIIIFNIEPTQWILCYVSTLCLAVASISISVANPPPSPDQPSVAKHSST